MRDEYTRDESKPATVNPKRTKPNQQMLRPPNGWVN